MGAIDKKMRIARNSRRRVKSIIRDLNYDFSEFSLQSLIKVIQQKLGKEIYMVAIDLPRNLQGMWLTDNDEPYEYIFYEKSLSAVHQLHVQIHELCHLLCGHPTSAINIEDAKQILSTADESILNQASFELTRFRNIDEETKEQCELEAEYLTNVIVSKVIKTKQIKKLTCSPSNVNEKAFSHLGLD